MKSDDVAENIKKIDKDIKKLVDMLALNQKKIETYVLGSELKWVVVWNPPIGECGVWPVGVWPIGEIGEERLELYW